MCVAGTPSPIDTIMQLLAAILHLGNVKFANKRQDLLVGDVISEVDGEPITVREQDGSATVDGQQAPLSTTLTDRAIALHWGNTGLRARFARQDGNTLLLFVAGQAHAITLNPSRESAQHNDEAGFIAPMSGTIVALHVAPGDTVAAGDAVITLEAMKMEHTLRATAPGMVHDFHVATGDSVSEGTLLVEFEEAADA